MEVNNVSAAKTNAGKGLNVAGFVIALVALVLWVVIAGMASLAALAGGGMGLAIFWLIFSLLGTGLAAMGVMAASKANGKKGLGIAGLIIGLVATILSVTTVLGVKKVHDTVGDKFGDALKEGFENLNDTAKLRESLQNMIEQAVDSTQAH